MKLFVFLGHLTIVGGQCMKTESNSNKCRKPMRNGYTEHSELVECVDHCLADYRGCMFMHWIPATKECVLFPKRPQEGEDVDCVIAYKWMCDYIAGEKCFEEVRGPTCTHELFPSVRSEPLCKTLCRVHPYCLGYLWNTRLHECRFQIKRTSSTVERRPGDVWMRKKRTCPGERCALLRIGVAGRAKKDVTSRSLYSCIKKGVGAKHVFGAQWNFHDHACWLQYVDHGRYIFSRYKLSRDVLDVIQNKECNTRPPPDETCFQKVENVKMNGGFFLNIKSEEQCVDICKLLGNCWAVGWITMPNRCIFHQFEKPMIRGEGYNTYRPCQHTPQHTLPDHRLVTSRFTRRLKLSPRELSTPRAIHILECAFKCTRGPCNSFTLKEKDGPICDVSDKLNQQYVRK